jgi:hypothetical protein
MFSFHLTASLDGCDRTKLPQQHALFQCLQARNSVDCEQQKALTKINAFDVV